MKITLRYFTYLILLILCRPVIADMPALSPATRQDLQTRLTAVDDRLAQLKATGTLSAELVSRAALDEEAARLQVRNLEMELAAAGREAEDKAARLTTRREELVVLKKEPVAEGQSAARQQKITELEAELLRIQEEQTQAQTRQQDLRPRLEAAQVRLREAQAWHVGLVPLFQNQQAETLENRTETERRRYRDDADKLRAELAALPRDDIRPETLARRHLLETRIHNAEERAAAALRHLQLTQIAEQLAEFAGPAAPQITHERLTALRTLLKDCDVQLALLTQKLAVLAQQHAVVKKRAGEVNLSTVQRKAVSEEDGIFTELLALRQSQLDEAHRLSETAHALEKQLAQRWEEAQEKALYTRRQLPQDTAAWQALLYELAAGPRLFWDYVTGALSGGYHHLQQVGAERWGSAALPALLLLGALAWGKRRVKQRLRGLLQERTDEAGGRMDTFMYSSLSVLLRLVDRNLGGLAITLTLALLVWIFQPAQATAYLVLGTAVLWLMIKLPVDLAKLLLASPGVPLEQANPHLYRQLRWMLILFGVLTTFTLLVHLLPFSPALRDLNDSLLMLFLVITVAPVLHIRNQAVRYLSTQFQDNRWTWPLRLVTLFVVFSILAVGLLGVLGYINLGWLMARQLSWFLVIFSGWLVLRGLLKDFVVFLKNVALQHSQRYGLLWTQDVIPLLQRLARIALAVAAVLLLLRLNGWDTAAVWQDIWQTALFSLGGSTITTGNFLLSAFALYMVFWFAGWIKQITYRWIYSGVSDLGARHSLSVFTQYAVLLVGGMITLRILGLDLTAFAVFAGALGVGLGFGMQNIANNFVSGLLLLAERPLRTGDLVNIGGTYEGEVTEIGVRSLTIRTWDYQEVIVPNSELISSPFTNWTRSDNIVRTVLYIGVSYDSDLDQVKAILGAVLAGHPAVLKDPEYAVLLNEFADSAVNFRINYYINLQKSGMLTTKSEVLFEIWNRFKQAEIEIPFPQRDVHIHSPLSG